MAFEREQLGSDVFNLDLSGVSAGGSVKTGTYKLQITECGTGKSMTGGTKYVFRGRVLENADGSKDGVGLELQVSTSSPTQKTAFAWKRIIESFGLNADAPLTIAPATFTGKVAYVNFTHRDDTGNQYSNTDWITANQYASSQAHKMAIVNGSVTSTTGNLFSNA